MNRNLHTVTGAFGFTGRYIARELISRDYNVSTLTNSPWKKTAGDPDIPVYPLNFQHPERLRDALRDTKVLFNTYWIRFEYDGYTFRDAVENSKILLEAAQQASVEKVVHISITNPSADSALPYFRGKAQVEQVIRESGLSYTILRPALLFGRDGILVNNIAWLLRRFPLFGLFGDGSYKLQPIHVADLASLTVQAAGQTSNRTIDAIGPETFTFREFVETIETAIGRPRPIISIPPFLALAIGKTLQPFLKDVLITRDEVTGLMRNLLFVDSSPVGDTRFTSWVRENAESLGWDYASELARRIRIVND